MSVMIPMSRNLEPGRSMLDFDAIRIRLASPRRSGLSHGEVTKPEDDQLPDLQAGAGRPLLREDLRPITDWEFAVRQVQAHEAPRGDLRQVRRRGDAVEGTPRAHGPHRASPAREPRVVLQGLPSRIGHILNISLTGPGWRILYFESYVVIDVGDCPE